MAVTGVFMLSTVSVAYTHLLCKSMMQGKIVEKRIYKSCCNPEGTELEVKSFQNDCNVDTKTKGERFVKEKCCCSLTKNVSQSTIFAPVTNTQTEQSKLRPGVIVRMLPDANHILTSSFILPRDKSPTQGRSISILISNFRI